jgi:hypothetical protein
LVGEALPVLVAYREFGALGCDGRPAPHNCATEPGLVIPPESFLYGV